MCYIENQRGLRGRSDSSACSLHRTTKNGLSAPGPAGPPCSYFPPGIKLICISGCFANVFSIFRSSATERLPCSDHSSTGMCTQLFHASVTQRTRPRGTDLCLLHCKSQKLDTCRWASKSFLNIRLIDSGLPDGLFRSRRPFPGPP